VSNRTVRNRRGRPVTVRISYDADLECLRALKFGEAADGQLSDETDEPVESFLLFRRGRSGPVIGFGVDDFWGLELPDPDTPLLPRTVRFDAPTLGLRRASAEEVILAARTSLDESTPDVVFFDMAVDAGQAGDLEAAEALWRCCLATGEMAAHFGLGYTLCDACRHAEAYGHLRTYTEIPAAQLLGVVVARPGRRGDRRAARSGRLLPPRASPGADRQLRDRGARAPREARAARTALTLTSRLAGSR